MDSQKTFKIFIIGVLACALLVGSFFLGVKSGYEKRLFADAVANVFGIEEYGVPESLDLTPLWRAWQIIDEKYPFSDTPSGEERLWGMVSGLVASIGDPYSVFLPPQEATIFEENLNGNFGGVGIEVGVRDGLVTVISALKDTPAYKAGIKAGDIIVEVDGQSTAGFSVDDVVTRIRGEKGATVTITVFRENKKEGEDGETLNFDIVRDTIRIPTIDTEILPGGIFAIRLYNFSSQSPVLFEGALREFVQITPGEKLIIDLRGNAGGFLEAATEIASLFLPEGKVIVREDYGSQRNEAVYRSKGYDFFNTPPKIVILVDRGSASASEILAAALSEHGLATVVGEKTFGKGSVQELIDLTSDSYIKLTIAKWKTPGGKILEGEGVSVDVAVENENGDRDLSQDKAIEILNTK